MAPPSGLVVSGTLPRLGASLATVHGWTQLPMPESAQATEILAGEPMGAIVDLDRPIDLAVVVAPGERRPRPQVAVAGGVRDLEAAKAILGERYKLMPGENGALIIERPGTHAGTGDGDNPSDDDGDGRVCELAPAYGPSATRLVCAWDAKTLAALAPWLTRGATRTQVTQDAHVELWMAPLKPAITSARALFSVLMTGLVAGNAQFTGLRELANAGATDAVDFATDLDTASLDAVLSDPGATATLNLRLSGSASALGRTITGNPDRNGPPPAAFWQMPADADVAFFDRGFDAKSVDRARQLASKALDDELAEAGVKEADRKAVEGALGALVAPAPMVYASGVDLDAARNALAAERSLPDTGDRREAKRLTAQAILGWRVIEQDAPAGPSIDALKGLVASWGRASSAYKARGTKVPVLRSAPMPKGAALPKDAQHFVVEMPFGASSEASTRASKAAKPLSIDVLLVPDGARSWFGIGGDAALVAAKLASSMGGSGDNLGSRPELASMKSGAFGAAGFFDARSLPELVQQVGSLTGDSKSLAGGGEVLEGMAQLPHQGATPIPFSLTAPVAAPGTAVGTLQLPRGTIDDVLVLILKYGI